MKKPTVLESNDQLIGKTIKVARSTGDGIVILFEDNSVVKFETVERYDELYLEYSAVSLSDLYNIDYYTKDEFEKLNQERKDRMRKELENIEYGHYILLREKFRHLEEDV